MHSLKNTIVAVGLLGLSFVFYQMSAPDQSNFEEIDPPVVTDLNAALAEVSPAQPLQIPSLKNPLQVENQNPFPAPPEFVTQKSQDLRVELPSPKITNPVAPQLNPPKDPDAFVIDPPEFKPRPEATFDFSGKSAQPSTIPANAQQRDQNLITALKKQETFSEGLAREANAFALNAQLPAKQASFEQDSTAATASKIVSIAPPNQFKLRPASTPGSDPYADLTFSAAWPIVDGLVAEQKFRESLQLLTRFYRSPGLTGPQRQQLDGWLDALATKVVFSNEHHLTSAYVSKPGDSLLELGRQWGVPGQLIYNINKNNIANPLSIQPGTELKKITGPVNAEVDLNSNIMTLYVEELYAGRFNIKIGTSGSPRPGDFRVVGKLPGGHDWQDATGTYPPGDPNNHYGENWIALEGSLCMHAVDANTDDGHRGCLGLSEIDAEDVFAILSEGSTVSIR